MSVKLRATWQRERVDHMEHARARTRHYLMEATAEDLAHLEAQHAIHREAASRILRKRGVFPDKKGFQSTTLLLRAIRAMRVLDHAAAEKHVKEWKACAQERMDAQLFGESAVLTLNTHTAERTVGTDEATRVLGEWMKEWSEKLEQYVDAVLLLSM